MQMFKDDIETLTHDNTYFRRVLHTGAHSQLVLMCLQPLESIDAETHPDNDQFFRFEEGEGKVIIGDETFMVGGGDAIIIPAGAQHTVMNTSDAMPLKMYTLYSPAHHPDGTIHKTKAEAME